MRLLDYPYQFTHPLTHIQTPLTLQCCYSANFAHARSYARTATDSLTQNFTFNVNSNSTLIVSDRTGKGNRKALNYRNCPVTIIKGKIDGLYLWFVHNT